MKCASEAFYRRFLEFLHEKGLTPIEHAMPEEPLEIYREREYICSVLSGGKVHYKEQSADADAVTDFIADNYRNYILCENLFGLPFDGVEDYKKFYEVGNTVLAAKLMKDDTIQYVTWEYGYDRKSVIWGHYFGSDFTAAKQDFAVRAELVDSQKLLTDEQFQTLHAVCLYRLMNDMELTYKDEQALHKAAEQIETMFPQLAEQPEPEASSENEFSEEV